VNLVADASTLIGELLRARGRELLKRSDLRILVTEEQWAETERGLAERAVALRRRLSEEEVQVLVDAALRLADTGAISVVPRTVYAGRERIARRRIRDQNDWPAVALALAADAAILTNDPDFLGCGIATWTVETLLAELADAEDEAAGPPESHQ
jgi:predicted nucleic acid-binding protein